MSREAGKGDGRRPGKGFDKGYDLIDWPSRRKPEENKDDRSYVVIHHEDWVGPICSEDRKKPRRQTED